MKYRRRVFFTDKRSIEEVRRSARRDFATVQGYCATTFVATQIGDRGIFVDPCSLASRQIRST
jgi:hypothetical protein